MSNVLKLFAVLASCALALGGMPASAQEQRPALQTVTQFDDATIRYLLDDMDAEWTVERGADGNLVYRATAEGDLNFTLAPTACTPGSGCAGMLVIALFTGMQVNNVAQFDAYLHNFNDTNPSAKVVRGPQGSVALQTYINVTGGISYRNLQSQMLVFGQNIFATSRALAFFEGAQ